MKSKHQRLILALAALVAIIAAGLLAASALKDEAAYFYVPNDVKTKGVEPGKAVRLGGMVEKGSLRHEADGVTIRFTVTDGKAQVAVTFKGIAPDLFREGLGCRRGRRVRHTRHLRRLQPPCQARRALHAARDGRHAI
jgi:cytochrome c-type biogenesis protein CcmE